jgi:hypothetical protein
MVILFRNLVFKCVYRYDEMPVKEITKHGSPEKVILEGNA